MGDNTILTPGLTGGQECYNEVVSEDTTQYLQKDAYLGEYEQEEEKALVRANIGVPSEESVYNKQETDILVKEMLKSSLQQHLNAGDPHGILPNVKSMLEGVVYQDGSTPFIAPQRGVDPIADYHLATKRFVTKLLNEHTSETDPHRIMDSVQDALASYAKLSQVYLKNQVYTTQEIDNKLGNFLKNDGTTPFKKPQIGVEPTIDSHLATKRYVDKVAYDHLVDIDPHGFLTILNQRLSNYYNKSETYTKAQTYSRVQIDTIINSLVLDAAKEAIDEHNNQYDPHGTLQEIKKEKYVKQDGSVPFTAPQKGVEAVEPNDLVTLSQFEALKQSVESELATCQPIWKTSGPVQTTVGFMEDNIDVPATMTMQEVLDAIFYGSAITLVTPEYGIINQPVKVEMGVRNVGLMERAELYQNGELIGIYYKDDFTDGYLIVDSLPILEDTKFEFVVYYTNGAEHRVESFTKVAFGIFVGLLPKWYTGANISWNYLMELIGEDPVNNVLTNHGDNVSEIKHKYDFEDVNLKHPFLVVPENYPNLYQMQTPSQQFGIGAFDVIDAIPLEVPGLEESVIYKIYIYRQALVALHQPITFKFEENESIQ